MRWLIRLVRTSFGAYKDENGRFRDAAACLSEIRDAQALIETYDALANKYAEKIDKRSFTPIRRRLTERRQRVSRQQDLEGKLATFRRAMVDARARAEDWTVEGDGFDVVAVGLGQTHKRAAKALETARDRSTAANLHNLRKRVKYHRYHANLLSAIWPNVLSPHADVADDLGDRLGQHHNLAVFRQTLADDEDAFGDLQHVDGFVALIDERQSALQAEALILAIRLFAKRRSTFAADGRRIGMCGGTKRCCTTRNWFDFTVHGRRAWLGCRAVSPPSNHGERNLTDDERQQTADADRRPLRPRQRLRV